MKKLFRGALAAAVIMIALAVPVFADGGDVTADETAAMTVTDGVGTAEYTVPEGKSGLYCVKLTGSDDVNFDDSVVFFKGTITDNNFMLKEFWTDSGNNDNTYAMYAYLQEGMTYRFDLSVSIWWGTKPSGTVTLDINRESMNTLTAESQNFSVKSGDKNVFIFEPEENGDYCLKFDTISESISTESYYVGDDGIIYSFKHGVAANESVKYTGMKTGFKYLFISSFDSSDGSDADVSAAMIKASDIVEMSISFRSDMTVFTHISNGLTGVISCRYTYADGTTEIIKYDISDSSTGDEFEINTEEGKSPWNVKGNSDKWTDYANPGEYKLYIQYKNGKCVGSSAVVDFKVDTIEELKTAAPEINAGGITDIIEAPSDPGEYVFYRFTPELTGCYTLWTQDLGNDYFWQRQGIVSFIDASVDDEIGSGDSAGAKLEKGKTYLVKIPGYYFDTFGIERFKLGIHEHSISAKLLEVIDGKGKVEYSCEYGCDVTEIKEIEAVSRFTTEGRTFSAEDGILYPMEFNPEEDGIYEFTFSTDAFMADALIYYLDDKGKAQPARSQLMYDELRDLVVLKAGLKGSRKYYVASMFWNENAGHDTTVRMNVIKGSPIKSIKAETETDVSGFDTSISGTLTLDIAYEDKSAETLTYDLGDLENNYDLEIEFDSLYQQNGGLNPGDNEFKLIYYLADDIEVKGNLHVLTMGEYIDKNKAILTGIETEANTSLDSFFTVSEFIFTPEADGFYALGFGEYGTQEGYEEGWYDAKYSIYNTGYDEIVPEYDNVYQLKSGEDYLVRVNPDVDFMEAFDHIWDTISFRIHHMDMSVTAKASSESDGEVKFVCHDEECNHNIDVMIAQPEVSYNEDEFTYNGTPQRPEVKVGNYYGDVISEDNYEVIAPESKNAGNYDIVVKFNEDSLLYTGELKVPYEIKPIDISTVTSVKLSSSVYTYNGTYRKPVVSITGLKNGTDYKVAYSSNKDAGKAKVTITAVTGSNATGTRTVGFDIKPIVISSRTPVKLSSTVYTYNGYYKKPVVSITGLKNGTDYKVTYSSNKYVGTAKVKITATGRNTTGSTYAKFTINPKGTYITGLSRSTKAFTVKWSKRTAQTSGYQIRYSLKSSMADSKYVTITKTSTVSKKISYLKAKKKYYVQVRTYKTVSGKKYYSGWSTKKSVTTR